MKTKNQIYVLLIIMFLAIVAFFYFTYRVKIKEAVDGDPAGEGDGGEGDSGEGESGEGDGGEGDSGEGDSGEGDGGDGDNLDGGDAGGGDAGGGDQPSGEKQSKKGPQQKKTGKKSSLGVKKNSGMQPTSDMQQGISQLNIARSQQSIGGNQQMIDPYVVPESITGSDIKISSTNDKSVGSVVEEIEDDLDKELPSMSKRLNALDKRLAAFERLAAKPSGKAKKK